MNEESYQAIFKRRSVRKFSDTNVEGTDLSELRAFMNDVSPLFPDIRTEIVSFNKDETKGILRTDAPHYIALFSEPKEGHLVNAGFMLQQIDLHLSAKGLGNCYQGMAKLVKGVQTPPGMELVMMMSFGRPAEPLHRSSIAEFKREPLSKISSVKGHQDIMEAVRLAPSGVNNQSWFFTGDDGTVHAYSERSMITDRMNRINVGIALNHMYLAATHSGKQVQILAPGQVTAGKLKGYEHVASMKLV